VFSILFRSFSAFSLMTVLLSPAHAEAESGKNVLIIGDSLSAVKGIGFGDALDQGLRQKGYSVNFVAACGSRPSNFFSAGTPAKTRCGYLRRKVDGKEEYLPYHVNKKNPKSIPKLGELVSEASGKPDLIVLQQGTNLYGHLFSRPRNGAAIKKEVKDALKAFHDKFPDAECLWAAPPKITRYDGKSVSLSDQREMLSLIQAGIDEYSYKDLGRAQNRPLCEVLDGTQFTKNPDAGDGTHYSSKNPEWVAAAMRGVEDVLAPKTDENVLIHSR
jgi:hypothetical protein